MTKEEYKAQRDGLMKVANEAVSSSDLETARKTRAQIEELDNKFEEEAKEAANIASLEKKEIVDIMGKNQPVKGEVIDRTETPKIDNETAYRGVFAKKLQGRILNDDERRIFDIFNPSNATQTTSSHTAVVPTTLMAEIFREASAGHPILAAVDLTYVKGNVTYAYETAAGSAAWVAEASTPSDSVDTTAKLELKGFQLAKVMPISYTLKEMSTDAFLLYIRDNIADKIGAALATAVAQGSGSSQPKGITTALEAESSTPQVASWTASTDDVDYAKVAGVFALVGSGYMSGTAVYATNAFVWNKLALIKDTTGRPIFIPDASEGAIGRLFGAPVYVEDGVPANAMIVGDVKSGYRMNVSKDLEIMEDDKPSSLKTDYVGVMVVDGGLVTTKAFAYLKKSA